MNRSLFLFSFIIIACHTSRNSESISYLKTNLKKKIVYEGLKHPCSTAFLSENQVVVAEKDGDLVIIDLVSKKKKIIKGFPKDLTDSIRIKT